MPFSVDLLIAMGYGGTSEEAGRALGQSGDNGVDGVVDQDPLGVDQIYVQAKRYAAGNNWTAFEKLAHVLREDRL